ncbi:MAG: hypothetical protein O7C75_15655, partial [Verrucomicrobia bacterium]|nr:hypothetical protein [Verrucomicrobiota bacterium]
TNFGKVPTDWNQLSWGHLVENETELHELTHINIAGRLKGHKLKGIEWGFNPAHMALTTLQRSVRIAIHASSILPSSD